MTEDSDVSLFIFSIDNGHDIAFRLLDGFMVSALHSLLSYFPLFQLSDEYILERDQIGTLKETGSVLSTLLAGFPIQASQVLHISIVRRTEISFLDLDDGGAELYEKVTDTSVFRPEETVHFKVRLRIDYLQSVTMRKRIERRADAFTEDEQVANAVEQEDVILYAQETSPPSDPSSFKPSAILSEALKSYCRNFDRRFQEKAEMLEINRGSLHEQVDMVLTDPPYNGRRVSGRCIADYEKLITDNMAAIAILCRQFMKSGSRGNALCPNDQF